MRFTAKVLISAVLVALVTYPGYAMLPPQGASLRAAFDLLLKTDEVQDSAVGYAGTRPKEYDAFETLWHAGKAAEDYALKLISDGTPAARVYGAMLLLNFDEAAARREFQKLKEDKNRLLIVSGCIGMQETVGALVQKLDRGEWVIVKPMRRPVRRM